MAPGPLLWWGPCRHTCRHRVVVIPWLGAKTGAQKVFDLKRGSQSDTRPYIYIFVFIICIYRARHVYIYICVHKQLSLNILYIYIYIYIVYIYILYLVQNETRTHDFGNVFLKGFVGRAGFC